MKSKIWPQRPRKWPLDLNDLGGGWVDFLKNYIFKISASSWGKWAIAQISSQTFKIQNFVYFIAASEDRELKTCICKSLSRKPSYSSFFSAWCTDFKNVFFEKILNQNLSKLDEIQNFASATSKMTSWPQRPRKGLSDFFQKLHF